MGASWEGNFLRKQLLKFLEQMRWKMKLKGKQFMKQIDLRSNTSLGREVTYLSVVSLFSSNLGTPPRSFITSAMVSSKVNYTWLSSSRT